MTFRIIDAPPAAPVEAPAPRVGGTGLAPDLLDALVPSTATEAAARLLRDPNTLVVTTGQQPGLFTGPLYTVYKALSAAALASRLQQRWDRPVVPLFWLAGDDHDFAEANHAAWLAGDGSVTTFSLDDRDPAAPLTPMYRQPLGPEVTSGLELLAQTLPSSEYRRETLEWLGRHYRGDMTIGHSFGGALAELLAPFGIVCLDSTHRAVKQAAIPFLLAALRTAPELDGDLAIRAAELSTAGLDPRVHVGDGATLVLLEASQGRDRLTVDRSSFATRRSHERYSYDDLRSLAQESPELFSPNVLLRPVVESALLPTVAYVAGPGELRYLRLTDPIYRRLEVPVQRPVPRWSGLVVERRVDRVLEKFGASPEELMEPDQALERRVVRAHMPAPITQALASMRATIDEGYDTLASHGARIDATMAKPVEGSRHQALKAIDHIEKRLRGHLKQREEVQLRQISHAREAVLPGGHPQERVLTVATYRARYGDAFLTAVSRAATAWYDAALEGTPIPS